MSFIVSIALHVLAIALAVLGVCNIIAGAIYGNPEYIGQGIAIVLCGGAVLFPARLILMVI